MRLGFLRMLRFSIRKMIRTLSAHYLMGLLIFLAAIPRPTFAEALKFKESTKLPASFALDTVSEVDASQSTINFALNMSPSKSIQFGYFAPGLDSLKSTAILIKKFKNYISFQH